jgi:hypothetical protein
MHLSRYIIGDVSGRRKHLTSERIMSLSDYLLYTGLFVAILATQLGTRRPDFKRLILPVVIVAGIGAKYLRNLPTGATAHLLLAVGVGAGLVFGLASIALIKVRRDERDGSLVTVAGWPYAAVWTLALALRLGFAYGSTHWFSGQIASFSRAHHVPATAYGTAFVLMVLTMIAVRTAGVLLRARSVNARIEPGTFRLAQRLGR